MKNEATPTSRTSSRAPCKFDRSKYQRFKKGRIRRPCKRLNAVSLFSGGGVGDFGYHLAGFEFLVHAELHPRRCEVIKINYPSSNVHQGDLREMWTSVVKSYRSQSKSPPSLVAASPPCQGMTTTSQRRDRNLWRQEVSEDDRNYLYRVIPEVVNRLHPRVVVVENVPEMLVTGVTSSTSTVTRTVAQSLHDEMPGYVSYVVSIQMADYGIPQLRERAFFIFVNQDETMFEAFLNGERLPVPAPTHGSGKGRKWVDLRTVLLGEGYKPLDSSSSDKAVDGDDPLHFVPTYDNRRYSWISQNPPNKGLSSYMNLTCPSCGSDNSQKPNVTCKECGALLSGVPSIQNDDGSYRLIRGRKTAYRRMKPDRPAQTITTASGRFSSDYTIHPWENRILSIRECADLQSIPRTFALSIEGKVNVSLAREVIGEAIPPWFTYLLGNTLYNLLEDKALPRACVLSSQASNVVSIDKPFVGPISGGRAVDPNRIPALNGSNFK